MEHRWDVTPAEAIAQQKVLINELVFTPLPGPITTIAGADVSFNKYEQDVYAGIIVLSFPELEIIDQAYVKEVVTFPYIPGLLSYREIPPLLKAYERLTIKPDVVMVDGHGIAHPRRLGIAAHFGLSINQPTLGCAKSLLYGQFTNLGPEPGSTADLIDPKTQEKLGVALRSKKNTNPLFVSPGNLMDISSSIRLVTETLRGYRLPEPTRQAHVLVNRFRRGEIS